MVNIFIMGRARRIRNRKYAGDRPEICLKEFAHLLKFMKTKGSSTQWVFPANFSTTGRGMMARRKFKNGDCLISLPDSLLIGVKEALRTSNWSEKMLCSGLISLSGLQILCVFLIEGRFKVLNGMDFPWTAYIKTLPDEFDHHLFWNEELIQLLPLKLLEKVQKLHENVFEEFRNVHLAFHETDVASTAITWNNYRWAWCCVNTRCIYSNHEGLPSHKNLVHSPSDFYYLAPYLDLFNHSPTSRVVGNYNHAAKRYEIITLQPWKKYEQVFIQYGSHSTEDLFLEYGFICPGENPNDILKIPRDLLVGLETSMQGFCCRCCGELSKFFSRNGLDEGWSLSRSGVSYSARTAMLLFSWLDLCSGSPSCSKRVGTSLKQDLVKKLYHIQSDTVPQQVVTKANKLQNDTVVAMHNDILEQYEKCNSSIDELSKSTTEIQIVIHLYRVLCDILTACKALYPE